MTRAAVQAVHEFELEPADNQRLAGLCGPLDENLKLVESRLGVQIRRRGNVFRVSGEQADAAESVLRDLYEHGADPAGGATPEEVHLALRERERDTEPRDRPLHPEVGGDDGTEGGGASLRVPRGLIRARGPHQREYVRSILGRDLTFGIGPAGTGMTYLAVACAV